MRYNRGIAKTVLLLMTLLLSMQTPLCAQTTDSIPQKRVFTQEHPLIYEDAWDLWPYAYLNEEGEPVGFNIDLLKLIFGELDIPYTIKLKPTGDALRDLKSGKSDLMLGMDAKFHNEFAKYGESVVQLFTHSVVHHKDNPTDIKTLNDLSNHKVIVHTGSFSHHLMIQKGWGENAIPYDDMQDAVQKAHLDHNNVIVWNTNSLKWLIRKYGFDELEVTPVDIQHGEYKFMANNPELLHKLDSVFAKLRAEDRLQPILNKWFYPDREESGVPDWIWQLGIVLIVFTLAAIIYYLVYRFREEKMTKTLRKSNTRLSLLLKTSKVKIWIYDIKTHTITMLKNDGSVEMTYSGIDYAERTSKEDFLKLRNAIKKLAAGESKNITFDMQAKDRYNNDEIRYFTMTLSVLRRDKNGRPTHIIGTRNDITEDRKRQRQIEDAMTRHQSIFNSAMTDMVYYDENGIIKDMNMKGINSIPGGLQAVLDANISVKDVLGMDDISIENIEPVYLTQIYKSADDQRALNRFLKRKDFYYELQLTPVRDENGKLLAIYGSGQNVTEKARAYKQQQENILKLQKINEEQEMYIRNIDFVLKNGGAKLVTYLPDTHILNIYDKANSIQYKLTQTRALAFVAEDSKNLAQRMLNNMDNRSAAPINTTVKTTIHKGGKDVYLHLSFIPTINEEGIPIIYFGMCRDVSDIKLTEKELERETIKAQEVETLKNAFLHNMSYEIRTPLNTVVGFAELFEMEHSQEDEAVFINEIKQSSAHLLRLINDILYLSRLDARMIEFKTKPVDFASIFEARCQANWENNKNPDVKYIVHNPYQQLILDIDEQNLGIVIDKILTNAIQHTTSGQVGARYDYTGDSLVIAVRDTGTGIPEERLAQVFERFNSSDSQGTGLGLPICQEIVRQMGGKITIKSEVGKGTIVWVSIPCNVIDIERK